MHLLSLGWTLHMCLSKTCLTLPIFIKFIWLTQRRQSYAPTKQWKCMGGSHITKLPLLQCPPWFDLFICYCYSHQFQIQCICNVQHSDCIVCNFLWNEVSCLFLPLALLCVHHTSAMYVLHKQQALWPILCPTIHVQYFFGLIFLPFHGGTRHFTWWNEEVLSRSTMVDAFANYIGFSLLFDLTRRKLLSRISLHGLNTRLSFFCWSTKLNLFLSNCGVNPNYSMVPSLISCQAKIPLSMRRVVKQWNDNLILPNCNEP
jgi:hypothetical protein